MTGKMVGAALLVGFIGLLFWLPMRRRPARPPSPVATADQEKPPGTTADTGVKGLSALRALGGIEISGASFRQSDKAGRPILEVTGDRIVTEGSADRMRLRGVKATFFEEGKPAARFEAGAVEIDYAKDRERVTFTSEVRILSHARNAELRAGRVEYELKTRRLAAFDAIQLDDPILHLEANELRADLGLGNVTFIGPTRGTLRPQRRL